MKTSAVTKARARPLRQNLSPPELKLWLRLRTRGDGEPIFRRQEPIGPYVVDFYCAKARLAIEVDSSWHGTDEAVARDNRKTGYLRSLGLKVERISASSVFQRADDVAYGLRALAKSLIEERGLQPPPSRRC